VKVWLRALLCRIGAHKKIIFTKQAKHGWINEIGLRCVRCGREFRRSWIPPPEEMGGEK
jgi:hypothetical protein